MANRTIRKNYGTLAINPVALFINFAVGAAGAVAAAATANIVAGGLVGFGPGVKSVVHTATGVYTITFEDSWTKILTAAARALQGTATQAQATAQQVTVASITQNTVVLNTVLASAPTILADPASGIQISAEAVFDNTGNPY